MPRAEGWRAVGAEDGALIFAAKDLVVERGEEGVQFRRDALAVLRQSAFIFQRRLHRARWLLGCRLLMTVLPLVLLAAQLVSAPTQKFSTQFPLDDPAVPRPVLAEPTREKWSHAERGPVTNLQVFAREPEGTLWLGSEQGAARFDSKAPHPWDRWQYFFGRRYLADDAVQNIWFETNAPHRRVWVRTRSHVSLLEWRPMTLEQKAEYFERRIEARHVRHGLVADSTLRVAGDVSTNVPRDNDNDGLWTAMFLGAEAFRYATTHVPDARAKARRSLDALFRLEEITGVPGFYARSFLSKDEPPPHGGEWHPTPDGRWLWKGDTSSDESVGHYFAYSVYYDLVANEADKVQIRKVVARMTDYLIAHDYDMPDLDGKPTRWGQWSEKYFQTEEGKYEAALRSIELLSFLEVTHHITGDKKYLEAYQDRIAKGYAKHAAQYRRWPGGGEINFSDDELAYLSWYPLLQYENGAARNIYLDELRYSWGVIRPDRNPLWNYISAASGAGPMTAELQEESRRTLERIPMDMVEWTVRNSHRADVKFQEAPDRFVKRQLTTVLAPDERAVQKWNSNPYIPDGGANGHAEDDGAYFLLPYWMGRYYGWVK